MSEFRTLIDRVAERATPPPDAFERLTGRRTKRQRNRRIGTALLAIVVAGAGLSGLFLAFGHAARPPVPVTPSKIVAVAPLWPQYSPEQAHHAQERADAGDPAFTWLLDPALEAKRFASQYLGWRDVSVETVGAGLPARATVGLCGVAPACQGIVAGEPRAEISLSRLGRVGAGGIWSITGVDDAAVFIWGPEGRPLQRGSGVGIDGPLAAIGTGPRGLGLGALTAGPCGFVLRTRQARSALTYFDAGANLGDCPSGRSVSSSPGYVLAFTPGDAQLLIGGNQPQAIRLTAIPVTFVPSTGSRPTPSPTQYSIELPATPGPLDEEGLTILDARTNLPDGMKASIDIESRDLGTPLCCVPVEGGQIRIRVANNDCQEVNHALIGTRLTVTVRVASWVLTPYHCPPLAGVPCGIQPQPPRIIAVLGPSFEYVRGPQLILVGALSPFLKTDMVYQLPSSTCTAKLVGGRQIKITPSR